MKKLRETLNISLNGHLVGGLTKTSHMGLAFRYDETWLNRASAIPLSLSLPLTQKPYTGPEVASYFGNLLPDSDDILRKIAERVGARGRDSFSLLAEIGKDCVGALQFTAEGQEIPTLMRPEGEALTDADIESDIRNLGRRPLGLYPEKGFRISIAGAQEKLAFLYHEGQWLRPLNATPTTHILKPALGIIPWESGDVDMRDSVWNEHYCMTLCDKFWLETASTSVKKFRETSVLCVKRFDRQMAEKGIIFRLPQEDMCQSLGVSSSRKYQNEGGPTLTDILNLLRRSDEPHKDQQTVFRAQVLFWLIGATDGHAKNFSIFLRPEGRFSLTPLYDVLSTQPAFDRQQIRHKDYRLALSVGHNNHYRIDKIHGRHFLESANAANLPEEFAREAICHLQDNYEIAFDATLGSMPNTFPKTIHDSIYAGFKTRLPLLKSAFASI